jgi:hypothetical protein
MPLDKQNHQSLVQWASDCAEHVLPLFEDEADPQDTRPRAAVEAGRAWVRGEITMSAARAAAFAAHTAARDAESPAARAAARAAGHAAATAHVPEHARHAADYAATAADVAGDGAASERDWQRARLPGHLLSVGLAVKDRKEQAES